MEAEAVRRLRALLRERDTKKRFSQVLAVLEAWEDMFHDWHCYAVLLPEGREAIARIGAFLKERAA